MSLRHIALFVEKYKINQICLYPKMIPPVKYPIYPTAEKFLQPQQPRIIDQYIVGSIRLELSNDDDYDLKTIQPLVSSS